MNFCFRDFSKSFSMNFIEKCILKSKFLKSSKDKNNKLISTKPYIINNDKKLLNF